MPKTDDSGETRPEWMIPSGVYIVTLGNEEEVNGYAAGWVVRVSEVPVMIQVAIWEENYSYGLAKDTDHFVVHILEEGQQDMAKHFGRTSGRDTDKFAQVETTCGQSDLPVIKDCLAYLECEVTFRKVFGDHIVLVGRSVNSEINRMGEALIYEHSDYEESLE